MKVVTNRFKIVILDTSKYNAFYNLINSNRARLEDFFSGTVSKTKTLKETKFYCKIISEKINEKSYFPYIILDLNDKFIGLVDVKNIDWNNSKAELGYFIDAHYEGKGIITLAVGHVIDYLTNTYKIRILLCRAGSENLGSIKVALNNGFEFKKSVKKDYRTSKGELVDLNYYYRGLND